MRERWAVLLKSSVVVVALFFIIQGRPPAIGQQRMTPVDLAPQTQAVQNALVNSDIATLRLALESEHLQLEKVKEIQNTMGNSITALDTNWKAAMGFIAMLQAGGMFLSFKKKTV